jgi:hypothetical protein
MTEYLCLTLLADAGESEAAFRRRLTALWSAMLKTLPAEYEHIYSEATAFDCEGDRVARRYMIDPTVVGTLLPLLASYGIAHLPLDVDDLYSKAEASSNEWFQLEH